MALLLLALLATLAWLVGARVQQVSQENTGNASDRRLVYVLTRDMANEIWETEILLQTHMLTPSGRTSQRFAATLDGLLENSGNLCATSWIQATPDMQKQCAPLHEELRALKRDGLRLIAMRLDPQQTYPGMAFMLAQMQPAAEEFIAQATLGIHEANEHLNAPRQTEVLRLFYDTLYAWSRMIGAFRLYVSNRFGIFDTSPDRAMQVQESVVVGYNDRTRSNLAALKALDKQGLLLFQQSTALDTMQDQYQTWSNGWRNARTIWSSERWRLDTPMIRDDIQPRIDHVWSLVRDIEKQIDTHSSQDLSLMTGLAGNISWALWLLVLAGALVTGIALLLFEAQIRRPIARVVAALKAEAAGVQNIVVPETRLVETRDLSQAFGHMRHQVHARQQHLKAVLDYAVEAIITINEQGHIESFNPAAEKLFGFSAPEVIGQHVALLMPEPTRSTPEHFLDNLRQGVAGGATDREREELAQRKDGVVFPISLKVSLMQVEGRHLLLGMIADISERQAMIGQMEDMLTQLNAREQRLHTILNNTAEGIITFDERGVIEGLNQSAEKLFGWKEVDIAGKSMAELIAPDNRDTRDDYLEHFLHSEIQRLVGHEDNVNGRHRDGSVFPMAVKISGMLLEGRQKYIALVSNISERVALIEHLRRLAEHDGLTGLYNRSYFLAELERVVDRVHRSEAAHCALLYIDLDHFKYVNDTLGHAAGDRLLVDVSALLNRRARKSDLVARLGGDEFTVLVYETTPAQVAMVADAFRRQLADYDFNFEGHTVTIGCSIGVAVIEPGVSSPTEIMSRADLACHLAKRGGRNQVHVFSGEDSKSVASMSLDMGWSRRIREAIDKNRFLLAWQPIVSTRTRAVSGYEVLVRMQDESGGLIMPSGFLPTAERFGLSLDIDRWVIVHAIETFAGMPPTADRLTYTINLSAQSLNSPEISDLIQQRIHAAGVDPALLTFEITETVAIADLNAAAALLARLRALGCRTALDDFGSGMSSFAYLKELPVDIVKIDGRFVRHIATSTVDEAMVRAMNDIAHALGKLTVAEYVEDEAAFGKLIELGVDYGQGYYLGRPETLTPHRMRAAGVGDARP